MDLLFRGTALIGMTLMAFWMKTHVRSVKTSWYKAQELRLRLLADPAGTYEAVCHHPGSTDAMNTDALCQVEVFRKSSSRGWVPLCTDEFTRASRWYEIRLQCRFPHGLVTPMSAKTRFWR